MTSKKSHREACGGNPFLNEDFEGDQWAVGEGFVDDEYSESDEEGFVGEEEDFDHVDDEFVAEDYDDPEYVAQEEGGRGASATVDFSRQSMPVVMSSGEPRMFGRGDKKVKVIPLAVSKFISLGEAQAKGGICWEINKKCIREMLCCTHSYGGRVGGLVKHEKPLGNLSQAVIVGAKVTKFENSGPVDLGLLIPGVPPKKVTAGGKKYVEVLPSRTRMTVIPDSDSIVFEGYEGMDMEAVKQIVEMGSPEELRAKIDKASAGDTYYVPKDHPVVGILAYNAQENPDFRVGLEELEEKQRDTNSRMELPVAKVDAVIDQISKLVYQQNPCTDLTEFQICFERTDCEHWDSLCGLEDSWCPDTCAPQAICESEAKDLLCYRFKVYCEAVLYVVYPDY